MAKRLSTLLATSALSCLISIPAHAQTADDEIVITATKRPETIFDVPVPVTAVSGEELEKAHIRDISDLQNSAPSLTFNQSTGGTQAIFSIRGIGTAGQNTGLEQSVGVVIDGIYRGRPGSALGDYVDIEQIEVLRGPQGTLFGKNTSAGVINVRTAKPSFEQRAKADITYGNYDLLQLRGVYSNGISEDLAFSLAGSYQSRDGYIDNLYDGSSLNDRDRWSLRGQLLWEPSDDFSLRLIADMMKGEENCCIPVPVLYGPTGAAIQANGGTLLPGTNGFLGGYQGTIVDIDNREVIVNSDTQPMTDPLNDKGISAELEYDFGDMTATLIGAHRTFESQPMLEGDYTDLDIFTASNGQDLKETSLEFRLSSNGTRTVDWLIGGYYFDQHIEARNILEYGADTRAYIDSVAPVVFGQPILNIVENGAMVTRGTFIPDAVVSDALFDYDAESFALFGNATWHVTDYFDLSFGARYTDESKYADYNINSTEPFSQVDLRTLFGGFFIGLRQLQTSPAVVPFDVDYDDDNLSITASASYEVSSNFNTYVRYAQGYKSGGFNLSRTGPGTVAGDPDRVGNYAALAAIDPSLTPLQSLRDAVTFLPEEAESIEVGFKSRLFDNKLKLDVSAFTQELENFQANSFDGTVFTVRNAGSVEGKGIELDYTWRMSDKLTYTGAASFQDVKYKSFTGAAATAAQAGSTPPQLTQDLTGRKPNFVSDVSATGNLTYMTKLSDNFDLGLRGAYRYRSKFHTGQDLDDITLQPSFWMFDASVALVPKDSFWSFEIWGKNLNDVTVRNIVFDTSLQTGSFSAFIDAPRTYGATLRLNWD